MKTIYFDITNFYHNRSLTGIQRVVRTLVPMFISNSHEKYKVRIIVEAKNNAFFVLGNKEARKILTHINDANLNKKTTLTVDNFKEGDIFFDLDSAWHNTFKRNNLYPKLSKRGVSIMAYIYDIIPVVCPEYAHPETVKKFSTFIEAVLNHADFIFTDSRSSERDILNLKSKLKIKRHIPTLVTSLGTNSKIKSRKFRFDPKIPRRLYRSKYLLFVATLEPRKNQELVYKAFKELLESGEDINLVFVGKEGWMKEDFTRELRQDALLNKKIFWLQNIGDSQLKRLYENSYLCLYLSEYEGYGLPIAEALKYGKPTIASKNSSMYEAGTDFADYVQYGSINEVKDLINLYLNNENYYQYKVNKILRYYEPINWEDVFKKVERVLVAWAPPFQIKGNEKLQHVCISIRLEDFKYCVEKNDEFVSFIKEYIVITKKELVTSYESIKSIHPIRVIAEEDILGESYAEFEKSPHQKKNWLIRSFIPTIKGIDREFIMLDDDSIPLKNVSLNFFKDGGRYKAYYYNDLFNQKRIDTSYDVGQQDTAEILSKYNFQLLSYSSHCPQIINTKIFTEAIDYFMPYASNRQLDEWSIYFNYATTLYPNKFIKTLSETLNWPSHPNDWHLTYVPSNYTYENYYKHLYEDGYYMKVDKDDLKTKLKIKHEQYENHLQTQKLMRISSKVCSKNNMVHGCCIFTGSNADKVIIMSIPYIFAGTQNLIYRAGIQFKILNPVEGSDYKLLIQNSAGASMDVLLKVSTEYVVEGLMEGAVEVPINIAITGLKDLNFAVKRNSTELVPLHNRYDSVVIGCDSNQSMDDALQKVSEDEIHKLIV